MFESFFGGAVNSVLFLIIPPPSTDLIPCRFYHHLSVTKFIIFLVVFLDETQGSLSVSISSSPNLNMSSFLNIVNNRSNSTKSSLWLFSDFQFPRWNRWSKITEILSQVKIPNWYIYPSSSKYSPSPKCFHKASGYIF
jgi:hypothetical protein